MYNTKLYNIIYIINIYVRLTIALLMYVTVLTMVSTNLVRLFVDSTKFVLLVLLYKLYYYNI